MHELSVCQGMLSQMRDIAAQHHARAVTAVTVQIGPLSGVVPELLAQAFSVASAGSIADGASLQLDGLPIRVRCETCGAETEASANPADQRRRTAAGQRGTGHGQGVLSARR